MSRGRHLTAKALHRQLRKVRQSPFGRVLPEPFVKERPLSFRQTVETLLKSPEKKRPLLFGELLRIQAAKTLILQQSLPAPVLLQEVDQDLFRPPAGEQAIHAHQGGDATHAGA